MKPRPPTAAEAVYWREERGDAASQHVVIGGPEEGDDVIPCPALAGLTEMDGHLVQIVHVPYELDEIELAALAQGGTLWLTTWGGLPVHRLEVVQRG